jgi:MFS family permease
VLPADVRAGQPGYLVSQTVRLYYGWWLMLGLGVTETISWGILNYAFVVYLAPMESELGWSRGDMTGAFSLALLLAGLAAIPVGRWLDKHGPRLLMTVGSIAGSLLVLAWSQVNSLPQLYAVFALIGLTMSLTLYDPAFATATRWFERQRVRAITLITLVAGFASTIFIPLAGYLVQAQGWRQSLVTLAVILAIGTIAPHALLLRSRPEDLGLATDGASVARSSAHAPAAAHGMSPGEALRHSSFRWLVLAFWLATISTIAVGVHILPYLHDRGYDPGFAAAATGLIGAMQVGARLLMAPFGSRTNPRIFAALMFALQPISLLVLLLVRDTPGVFLFVVLFGAQRGLSTIARPALLGDLYGRARFASIAGVLQFAISLAQAAAPVGAGAAYDVLHSYEPILWALTLISALAVVAVLPAKRQASDSNALQ